MATNKQNNLTRKMRGADYNESDERGNREET